MHSVRVLHLHWQCQHRGFTLNSIIYCIVNNTLSSSERWMDIMDLKRKFGLVNVRHSRLKIMNLLPTASHSGVFSIFTQYLTFCTECKMITNEWINKNFTCVQKFDMCFYISPLYIYIKLYFLKYLSIFDDVMIHALFPSLTLLLVSDVIFIWLFVVVFFLKKSVYY